MKSSPCFNCKKKNVTEEYNCHSPGNCKAYDDFVIYRKDVSESRNKYQKERTYESVSKLKRVKRVTK